MERRGEYAADHATLIEATIFSFILKKHSF